MVAVTVICEGQTEEQFIKRVVAPSLRSCAVYVKPLIMETSRGHRGGGVSFDRLKLHIRNSLNMRGVDYVTTFIDLYALDTDFPNHQPALSQALLPSKLNLLQTGLSRSVAAEHGDLSRRFVPHIQPHEFEALLFSDLAALLSLEPSWARFKPALQSVLDAHETPEHINQQRETAPSQRLMILTNPGYRKTRHGPLAAEKMSLSVIERACPHFSRWITSLRGLAPKP